MDRLIQKTQHQALRRQRVRARLSGTAKRPRLSVRVSNQHVTAQLIDDETGKTLAYASTVGHKITGSLVAKATWVGTELAQKAQVAKVKEAVFDRGAKRYHGRVKALADAAREKGLKF